MGHQQEGGWHDRSKPAVWRSVRATHRCAEVRCERNWLCYQGVGEFGLRDTFNSTIINQLECLHDQSTTSPASAVAPAVLFLAAFSVKVKAKVTQGRAQRSNHTLRLISYLSDLTHFYARSTIGSLSQNDGNKCRLQHALSFPEAASRATKQDLSPKVSG